MKTKEVILATILAGIMAACGQKETASSDLIYLNYQETEIQKEAPKLSTLLKDIRYVALETKDTCLLNRPTIVCKYNIRFQMMITSSKKVYICFSQVQGQGRRGT